MTDKQEDTTDHRIQIAGEGASRGAYSSVAYTLGMPVDVLNMGMKAVGLPTSETPFLGGKQIDETLQSGLSYYYEDLLPKLGIEQSRIKDKTDEFISETSYMLGSFVGFAKGARGIETAIKGAEKYIYTGGIAQFIEAGLEMLSPSGENTPELSREKPANTTTEPASGKNTHTSPTSTIKPRSAF